MADLTDEIGRSTRIVVSGYDRSRIHASRLVRGEKRTLVLILAGAIPKTRTIVKARFQCDISTVIVMSNPHISADQRQAGVDILASWVGSASMKCTLTFDNGDQMAQLAVLDVTDGWWFVDGQSQQGPTDLTVTA